MQGADIVIGWVKDGVPYFQVHARQFFCVINMQEDRYLMLIIHEIHVYRSISIMYKPIIDPHNTSSQLAQLLNWWSTLSTLQKSGFEAPSRPGAFRPLSARYFLISPKISEHHSRFIYMAIIVRMVCKSFYRHKKTELKETRKLHKGRLIIKYYVNRATEICLNMNK